MNTMRTKLCLAALMSFFVACSPGAKSVEPVVADSIVDELDSTDQVDFFFLRRTGTYDYSVPLFIRSSTIQISRRCGANCANFMRDVVDHVRRAERAECVSGQQNVVIQAGKGLTLVYSHSGRQIAFKGQCYMSSQSINEVIQDSSFIFG